MEKELANNIMLLKEFAEESGQSFGSDFIQEMIDLVSGLPRQPDIGATGRGSIDLEYGSVRTGQKYLDLEIYEKDRRVHLFQKDKNGEVTETDIAIDDINRYIQQFA